MRRFAVNENFPNQDSEIRILNRLVTSRVHARPSWEPQDRRPAREEHNATLHLALGVPAEIDWRLSPGKRAGTSGRPAVPLSPA